MGSNRRPRNPGRPKPRRGYSPEAERSSPSSHKGFHQASRRFWEERCGRPLSDEEVREITRNLAEFAKLLLEWDKRARRAAGERVGREKEPPK